MSFFKTLFLAFLLNLGALSCALMSFVPGSMLNPVALWWINETIVLVDPFHDTIGAIGLAMTGTTMTMLLLICVAAYAALGLWSLTKRWVASWIARGGINRVPKAEDIGI